MKLKLINADYNVLLKFKATSETSHTYALDKAYNIGDIIEVNSVAEIGYTLDGKPITHLNSIDTIYTIVVNSPEYKTPYHNNIMVGLIY